MDNERRAAPRRSAHVYFNKYIDGQPHLCEAVELSSTGLLLRKIREPDAPRACYALELAPGADAAAEDRVWVCASTVWSQGDLEALQFVGHSDRDRERIEALIERAAA